MMQALFLQGRLQLLPESGDLQLAGSSAVQCEYKRIVLDPLTMGSMRKRGGRVGI